MSKLGKVHVCTSMIVYACAGLRHVHSWAVTSVTYDLTQDAQTTILLESSHGTQLSLV